MNLVREFNDDEMMCFSGAEGWPSSKPLITYLNGVDELATLIAIATSRCIEVQMYTSADEPPAVFQLEVELQPLAAFYMLCGMPRVIDVPELSKAGFVRIA